MPGINYFPIKPISKSWELSYCTNGKPSCLYSYRHTQAYAGPFLHNIQSNSQGFCDAAFPITSPENGRKINLDSKISKEKNRSNKTLH